MRRRYLVAGVIAALFVPAIEAQQFEVVSVKRNPDCDPRRGDPRPGTPARLNLGCQTVLGLMITAYGVFADGATVSPKIPAISGGPGWMTTDKYDIAAKADGDVPFPRMAGPMLRTLLEERFQLKVRRVSKEEPVYFLTAAKGGAKMEITPQGACEVLDPEHPPGTRATPGQPMPNYCGLMGAKANGTTTTLTSHGATMEAFTAYFLSNTLGVPVIDKTGLKGRYEIQIEFARDDATASDALSIFQVVQAKLGLKLESGKSPVESLVVDHLERPAEN